MEEEQDVERKPTLLKMTILEKRKKEKNLSVKNILILIMLEGQ